LGSLALKGLSAFPQRSQTPPDDGTMDVLYQHIAKVEDAVFFRTANLFNLFVDLIFYDTTTATFSIDEPD
jgi:hypothetical protein